MHSPIKGHRSDTMTISKKILLWVLAFIILLLASAAWYWQQNQLAEKTLVHAPQLPIEDTTAPITPLKPITNLDPKVVSLGQQLFFDKRLSKDNSISCASCHNLQTGGDDNMPKSVGIQGQIGPINAPTVFNSAYNIRQFWDGRAKSLEEQAEGPIHNPVEMGSNWQEVIHKLNQDLNFINQYKTTFSMPITAKNLSFALAEFQRSLVLLDSPFDLWLKGDVNAISNQAKRGYEKFKSYGCIACHQGAAVGGGLFEKIGTLNDYFADRGNITQADLGRYNLTGEEDQRHEFKVPSLRAVSLTAPYFHDGSVWKLSEAITKMAWYQLGIKLAPEDVNDIEAFLKSLAGQVPTLEANH